LILESAYGKCKEVPGSARRSVFQKAVAAGAREIQPVKDQFYGDRTGGISDPFGHLWYIATHKEDVSPEELQKRAAGAH
jgi:PhnB protein